MHVATNMFVTMHVATNMFVTIRFATKRSAISGPVAYNTSRNPSVQALFGGTNRKMILFPIFGARDPTNRFPELPAMVRGSPKTEKSKQVRP